MALNIGIVSTRLSGTDGVSLEVVKWVTVLERMGHTCFFFAGESDWPEARSYVVPEAHFLHPEISAINSELFNHQRVPDTSRRVYKLADHLKKKLRRFVKKFGVQYLIIENALSLPMNVPLGLAITELIAETSLPAIAHHHDFSWERERYVVDAASDYLRAAFPPTLDSIQHAVLNSYAKRQLALHTGMSSTIVPNVMDFDSPPPQPDGYLTDIRSDLGVQADQFLLLQPTRIVPRKRIEKAIELARRLELNCALVVTHKAGDEGQSYQVYLRDFADLLGVNLIFAGDRCAPVRQVQADASKVYSLFDVYQAADLVTYPSQIEGFGNALLEAIYCRRPITTTTYPILKTDLQPKGFMFIEFDDHFQPGFVEQLRQILHHPETAEAMLERNFEIGRRHYSYTTLENILTELLKRNGEV